MRRVHPYLDLPDERADDRPPRLILVGFHRNGGGRTVLPFQLKRQNVDGGREMLQRRLRVVIAQLGEI